MKTWEIKKTQYRVTDFLSWQRSKNLVLSPSFQRRPVWQKGAKSYLIDTVIRGLPIPIIFLREQKSDLRTLEPKREIVDGQQRIRTIISFIDSSLIPDFNPNIDDFTIRASHNKDYGAKTFNQLDPDTQQRILDYEFSVHILPSQVGDSEVLEIFARMNATGVKLNDQELRNAQFYGEFKTCVYKLATEQLQRWRNWKVFSEHNIARMEEVELTSEFLILMLRGLSSKNQRAMDRIYKDYDSAFNERSEVERRFRIVMDSIDDNLGKDMPHLVFKRKALIYSLFAIIYDYQFGTGKPLAKVKPKTLSAKLIETLISTGNKINNRTAPESVLDACTRRTTNLNSRKTVFDYLKDQVINA